MATRASGGGAQPRTAAKKKVPAKKAAPPPPPPPKLFGGFPALLGRGLKRLWLGLATAFGSAARGIGSGARGLDPAHRRDGLGLALIGLAIVIAAGAWGTIDGAVGEVVNAVVAGLVGRLDMLVPFLVGALGVRVMRHPDQRDATGRIMIGWTALVAAVLGLIHVGYGTPQPDDGATAMRDAGGFVGWAFATPPVHLVTTWVAVPLLVLLIVFGLLVVTATPINAVPERLGVFLGFVEGPEPLPYDDEGDDDGRPVAFAGFEDDEEPAPKPVRKPRPRRRPGSASTGHPDAIDVAAAAAAALDANDLGAVVPPARSRKAAAARVVTDLRAQSPA
ncbi:DNA translocase FtsK, partial [Streptomyces sp. SID3343]|nr:DNA translocase FtsK [Streptomyces sp. SID3343]